MDEYKFGKELYEIMISKGITIENMSKKTNIEITKLKKKLKGNDTISADEIIEIMFYLNL